MRPFAYFIRRRNSSFDVRRCRDNYETPKTVERGAVFPRGRRTCLPACLSLQVRVNSQRDSYRMLNDMKSETLETRRNNQRLTMFYRMQHNMVSISPVDYLAPVQSSRSRRSGHDQMYQVPHARTDSFFPATYVCGLHYQHR